MHLRAYLNAIKLLQLSKCNLIKKNLQSNFLLPFFFKTWNLHYLKHPTFFLGLTSWNPIRNSKHWLTLVGVFFTIEHFRQSLKWDQALSKNNARGTLENPILKKILRLFRISGYENVIKTTPNWYVKRWFCKSGLIFEFFLIINNPDH